MLDIDINICGADGNYGPVQEDDLMKFCADKNGERIEEFGVLKGAKEAKEMNCSEWN